MARARLRWRQNRLQEALSNNRNCGTALSEHGFTNPGFADWRADAVQVPFALGEVSEARELAEENLELARRFRAPGAIGMASRIGGLVGDRDQLDTRAESVAVLRTAGSKLELARSLAAYGTALRRTGHRSAAQPVLHEGLDLATRCGADVLAEEARAELISAGARPCRTALSRPEALTASELRVARLAADNDANRDIAQKLFLCHNTAACPS